MDSRPIARRRAAHRLPDTAGNNSCMEVAVLTTLLNAFRQAARPALVAGALVFSTGCSDHILSRADDSRDSGLRLYDQRNYPEAAGAFRDALRQDPRDYQSYY